MKPVECHKHRRYWLASCDTCRQARLRTLASVQSCTVHAGLHAPDQHVSPVGGGGERVRWAV
jgi:hypothetical protein